MKELSADFSEFAEHTTNIFIGIKLSGKKRTKGKKNFKHWEA